jgi:secreted trypsin-like serine protease
VASLFGDTPFGSEACSGALLSSGRHVLTAAHCLTDGAGLIDISNLTASFNLTGGNAVLEGLSFAVHPSWTGSVANGFDIGVITLAGAVPISAPRYDLYRSSDELGKVARITGYGVSGFGATGENPVVWTVGIRRAGSNRYDGFISDFGVTPVGTVLGYDFDNGRPRNDAFGFEGFTADLGVGPQEVMIALGDSGGPSFLNGRIAGVHSFGARTGSPPDVDFTINASFGEFGADTRVSAFAAWVDSVATPIPEPTTEIGAAAGLILLAGLQRLTRKKAQAEQGPL